MATYELASGMQFRRLPREHKMATAITDDDRGHMNTFPVTQKVRIIQRIMSTLPMARWNWEGNNGYIRTMLQLRARGLRLIDLQPQETAFTAIWYRKERSLLGRLKAEVAAMVVWEFNGDTGGITTVIVWHL